MKSVVVTREPLVVCMLVDRGAFSCEVMLYLLLLKARVKSRTYCSARRQLCAWSSPLTLCGFPTLNSSRLRCGCCAGTTSASPSRPSTVSATNVSVRPLSRLLRADESQRLTPSSVGSLGRVKYGISAYYHFLSCFQAMPVAALVHTSRGRIFCVHGGISPEISDVSAIDALDRKREVPTVGPLCDLLWSDPAAAPVHSDGPGLEAQAQGSDASSGVSWRSNLVRHGND